MDGAIDAVIKQQALRDELQENCRFFQLTGEEQFEDSKPAIYWNGETFIQRGELAALVALPGTGKTHTCEAIAAKAISKSVKSECDGLGFDFPNHNDNEQLTKVYFQDTERPVNDNVRSYQRIARRLAVTGTIPQLTYDVVSEETDIQKKRQHVEARLAQERYAVVIIDGILDYSPSLNEEITAKETIVWLRSLAVKHDTAIIVTIHPNKGSETPAGHLGSFLYRYCRAMVLIRPSTNDRNVREITTDFDQGKLSHGDVIGVAPSYFTYCKDKQLMMSTVKPENSVVDIDKVKEAFFSFQSAEVKSSKLKKKYSKLTGLKSDNALTKHLKQACKRGILSFIENGPHSTYRRST